jgi:hypothetical protein
MLSVKISTEFGSPIISMEVEGEQRKLIVDTGSNVSILQPGVSRIRTSATPVRPYGLTGEILDVKGQQHVSFAGREAV